MGRPVQVNRKGQQRDVVDGAGLRSPGRWPKPRRRLPHGDIALKLQDSLLQGLLRAEKDMPGGSFKTALAAIVRWRAAAVVAVV